MRGEEEKHGHVAVQSPLETFNGWVTHCFQYLLEYSGPPQSSGVIKSSRPVQRILSFEVVEMEFERFDKISSARLRNEKLWLERK
eukprot:1333888-Amorphochlora_amoeboformis.AAC.1